DKGWDYFAQHLVGSGPWKVVSFQHNVRLELEAVETHWRAVPKFKNLTLLSISEEATKVAMLKTGELDMAMELSPDSVAGLKAAGLRVLGYYGSGQWYMPLLWDTNNPEKYAVSDVRVRKALSLGIDRKEAAEKIYGGYAQPSAVAWVPTSAYFFDPSVLKPDPYDTDQAKKLLAEAGYANGFTTKVWDSGAGGILSSLNLALAGYWRKIGVNAEVVPVDYATVSRKFFNQVPTAETSNTFFPFIGSGGTFGFDRVVFYHSAKGILRTVKNPRLEELIDKVPMTADPGEKKRIALEAALLAKNGYTMIAGLDVDTIYALGPKVGGLTPVKGVVGLAASYETMTHAK
ncbi:MAG: ABC transporter substrate-binding protein, partial [Chloroflexi bacterium]|nr:ABC transporter substrate-binding protein [Chloroflexota bacterium]